MTTMLGLHLLNLCMDLHAYFKKTTGTSPTRQLVWHNRFKGHLLLYLCGPQAQQGCAFHCTGYSLQQLPVSFWPLRHFSVWTQRLHCGSTGTATHEMPAKMVCQTVIGPVTPQTVPGEHLL